MKTLKLWIYGLAVAAAITVQLRAATVTATLEPAQISMGDSTQLTVTVSGSQEQATMPSIDGLEIQAVRTQTQFSLVNGSLTSGASVTYVVTPQRAGTFTIPALQVGDAKSQPLTLRVGQVSSVVPQSPAPAQNSGSGPVVLPPNGAPAPDNVSVPAGKIGSIEIALPKKEFYLGELVPIQVKVLLAEDAEPSNLNLPEFTGEGFSIGALGSNPQRNEEIVNGRTFMVLTWNSSLTAVKTGDFALSVKMPLTVAAPQRLPQTNDDDDTFNNFFRNAIAQMGNSRKNTTITGATEALKVLPLPSTGRPAGFSGAVGQFDAVSSATPTKVNAGDPITLRLTITGQGNFDRVLTDMLPADANWKTYSSKSHFDTSDSIGYEGTKTFDQPIIPNSGSITSVPPLAFSYFDPDARQYVTRTCPPIPIEVSGTAAPAPPPLTASTSNATTDTSTPPQPVAPAAPDLRMNQIDSGSFVSTLRPIFLSPLFLAGQALPLVALLGGLAFLRRRQDPLRSDRARLSVTQQAIRREVEAMDAAMRDQQAGPFFIHARSALQQRFGQEWGMRPEAITVTDLDARLNGDITNLRSIFEMADQATYSDLHFGDADLQQWRQVVLNGLEAKR